ncbi:acetyl-CoA carboxylase biotin carboxyl carrier protein [Neobacillus vireti]|uniref:acetyl-CoA carboxylase biotin carboxyl carrier protein n=1 Tax=Neobacillus vireti TaxID=220686 RepID=UPI0030006469
MSKNLLGVLNEKDVETLTTLIDKLEASSFNFLKLENQDIKIVIGKNGVTENAETNVQQASNVEQIEPQQITQLEAAAAIEVPVEEAEVVEEKQGVKTAEEIVTINAETTGLFYAQPEPGAEPYVKVGDTVQKDSTVCLIEIMKVYSAIAAGVEGVITEIHVEDADLVEVGQPLFSVKVK